MLRGTTAIETHTKKRVHWGEDVEDNEGKTGAKRQKIVLTQKKIENKIKLLKPHLFKSASPKLEEMLTKYSLDNKIRILSTGDLFRTAALASNIDALRFIIKTVPQDVAYAMLRNKSAFESFLCHECALEKLDKSDHQKRIEGFKIFFKIDRETAQEIFDNFDSKRSNTEYQLSLRNDLSTALTQLQEEDRTLDEEESTEILSDNEDQPSKNSLLKNLEPQCDINLALHGTTDHSAFNLAVTQESANFNNQKILNLTEITKKARIFPNISNASEKTL